ncbi:unnamed protein product [Cylindrotheca closterium]|uniref:Uncharacterized protein n=1 Tax=Cylindrotheca closterium TaxID=2856 RepID=A0AAD2FXG8_9STRA|nr:unnamed protein product [Cylindrotheca closterium]CAJ1961249.1 unnamed protein product [Cylindrotheca closterium]CAJ1969992.1 unnamed protein product [Cylindrotheca closterium]
MNPSDMVTEDGRGSPVPRNVQFNIPPNTPAASVSQKSQQSGTPPPPPKDIIGGVTFSAKPKLQINLIKSTVICPKEERELLRTANPKAYHQLEKDASGTSADSRNQQIEDIPYAKTASEVHDVIKVENHITEHLTKFGIDWFFVNTVFPIKNRNGEFEQSKLENRAANLLSGYATLTLEEVFDSVVYLYGYGYDESQGENSWMPTDLQWSGTYLKNQCTSDMIDRIEEDLKSAGISKDFWGWGPLIYKVLMDRISASSYHALKALRDSLEEGDGINLYSKVYDGNIRKFCTEIESTILMLRKNEKHNAKGEIVGERHMPKGLSERLLRVFSNTGNGDFDDLFQGELKLGNQRCLLENVEGEAAYGTPETILIQARKFYDRLNLLNQWETEGTRAAAFTADISPPKGKSGSKCFGCGRDSCRQSNATCPRHNLEANPEGKKAKAAFDAAKAAKKASKESGKKGDQVSKGSEKGDKTNKTGKSKWPPAPKGDDPKEQEINGTLHFYHFKDKKWYKCRKQKTTGEDEPSPNTGPSAHLAQSNGVWNGNGLFAGMSGYFSEEFSKVKVGDATNEEVMLQERLLKNAVDRAIRNFNKNLGQE